MVWTPDGPEGNESAKIASLIVPYTRGRGLDIGCGPWKPFPHFIGVDNLTSSLGHRPPCVDIVAEAGDLNMFASGALDFVFSSHFLEHVGDPRGMLTEWWRMIRPGGHLVLYLPHPDFYPRIGEKGVNPDHKHDFYPRDIANAMQEIAEESETGWTMVEDEVRSNDHEYSFFQVFRKEADTAVTMAPWRKPAKAAVVCRYGGIGDLIQASGVLPGLKEQGYHITFNTTPQGRAVIEHDPNVDAWLIQDRNQVPIEQLPPYIRDLGRRYDLVVNYNEVVERSILQDVGRPGFLYPDRVRRNLFGRINYSERHAEIAGVGKTWVKPRFYAAPEEIEWALAQRSAHFGDRPVVMIVLSGSSVHKGYVWNDSVVAKLMTETEAGVVLTGDQYCRLLEGGWEKEARVLTTSGDWTARQSLTFASVACEVVVGPETGILNAVGCDPRIAKVILMSHSSEENLTKHWAKVFHMTANVPCRPCLRMHHNRQFCPHVNVAPEGEPETLVAVCVAGIEPDTIVEAVKRGLKVARPRLRKAA